MMSVRKIHLTAACVAGLSLGMPAIAHVPYLEQMDYTSDQPFIVEDVENSKSLHADIAGPDDYDVYRITIDAPKRIYTTTNIPHCEQYETYSVTYALVGPGLPEIDADALPVELPAGHGGVIVRNPIASVEDRPVFFEPFGGRLMWEGPEYMIDEAPPGEYQMIVWNEDGVPGDYIAVIGQLEIFGPAEIAQVKRVSPLLKNGKNLHVDCNPQADGGRPLPQQASR